MRLLASVGNLSRGLVLILLFVFGIRLIDGGIEDAGIVVVANVSSSDRHDPDALAGT